MTRRRAILLALVVLTIVAFSRLGLSWWDGRGDGLDLGSIEAARLPQFVPADEAIRLFEAKVQQEPRSPTNLTLLGQMHLRKGRETGDAASYQRAEAAFSRALEILPGDVAATTYLAATLYSQHRFAEALDLARQAYARAPDNAQALATVGDAHLALGNYQDAEAAYQELMRLSPTSSALARMAHLEELHGRNDKALELMLRAASEALKSGLSGEDLAWYLVQVGELYFNTGHIDQAASHFQAALSAFPNYYLALSALAKARTAQGNLPDAIALYQRSTAILPQPSALAALADIYSRLGRSQEAQTLYDTIALIATLQSLNQQLYNRELVLFYADHDLKLPQALALAQQELAVRRDIFGYDALAWALYRNGRLAEARQAMEQALALGTQHASLFYHAGMVYYALGEREQARVYLERALELNPHFSFLLADSARLTLKELR